MKMTLSASSILAAALFAATAVVPTVQSASASTAAGTATVAVEADGTEQTVCGPRIRTSWNLLTALEKSVYLRAVARSMDDGYYIKFIEIHTEQLTTMEAHNTCMFIYWHRLLLLGFENMLRSYGGEFSCITVPYWDYVDDNARFLAGECSSMQDCALILRELGGSQSGDEKTITINGTPIEGTCVVTSPCDHFCEASHLQPSECARCVPRGTWATTTFPATTSVSSLVRQLFATPTIAGVTNNLELGIHDTIHNALGGAMEHLEAPADPIFFSHHATVDLLHSIYYNCIVGNSVTIPLQQKLADPRIYTGCARRESLKANVIDSNVLLPQSSVLLRTGEDGVNPSSVFEAQNALDPFFAALPSEYLSLSDIRDIGEFSYNYHMTGLLAEMFTTCPGASAASTIVGAGIAAARVSTVSVPFRRLEGTVNGTDAAGEGARNRFVEAVIVPSEQSASSWYTEALEAAMNTSSVESVAPGASQSQLEALEDVDKMTCVFYDECRGGVTDFNDGFKSRFHTNGASPCRKIVDNINKGLDRIKTPNWRSVFLRHMKCDDK